MAEVDFIVVGGGPAGASVARRLAGSAKTPKVLLLEAGGDNADKSLRVDAERFFTKMNKAVNYDYKSTPQGVLNGREIELDRGKGLGGTSAINFGLWNIPPRDDFEEIARRVGDKEWTWDAMKARLKRVETYHERSTPEYSKYIEPNWDAHGRDGPLQVSFPNEIDGGCPKLLENMLSFGLGPLNKDVGSGSSIGAGLIANTSYKGIRSTAKDLLEPAPDNLEVMTNAAVSRVLFDGKRAKGAEVNGKQYLAKKEVIISAGSLDAPKILQLSGVGPANSLKQHNIPVVHDNPRIGAGLKDHVLGILSFRGTDQSREYLAHLRVPEGLAAARKQWETNGSGTFSSLSTTFAICFKKDENVLNSAEFLALPANVQHHLRAETVPSYEITATGSPFIAEFTIPGTETPVDLIFLILDNGQSEGSVKLRSANPKDPPLVDAKFLEHPYDRKVAIEAMRTTLGLTDTPEFRKDIAAPLNVPKSTSDEDIWAWWQANGTSCWHMSSSVQMEPCVDTSFRVLGVENLRVADLSVIPIIANAHTQALAYLTGLLAGDKLVEEYGLDDA